MRIHKRKVIPALAFMGLALGTATSAAEAARQPILSEGISLPASVDHKRHKERKKEFDTLIQQDDYEKFREMVANTPMAEIVDTKGKFDALVEAHDLRTEGRRDEARMLLQEAGLKPFGRPLPARRSAADLP